MKGTIKRKPSRFVVDDDEDEPKDTALEFLLKEERRKGKLELPKQSNLVGNLSPSTSSERIVPESPTLRDGLSKWFRVCIIAFTYFTILTGTQCEIFPSSSRDFSNTLAECKQLVVENNGTVLEHWTYPGGFMFKLPWPSSSPFDPLEPTILGGYAAISEFQPYLEPHQHLVSVTSSLSSKSSIDNNQVAKIEEIPLLRSTPEKKQQRWLESVSPESKSKMQSWLNAQRKKREGVQYDLHGGTLIFGESVYHELSADSEIHMICGNDVNDESESDWESDSGSEFSVATGLESVRFLADCGSLF